MDLRIIGCHGGETPKHRTSAFVLDDRLAIDAGTKLLDVACGSGYAAMMAAERGAAVAGIDAAEGLIEIARARLPGVPLHLGNMTDFALERRFDVITLLFSSIAYVVQEPSPDRTTTKSMANLPSTPSRASRSPIR